MALSTANLLVLTTVLFQYSTLSCLTTNCANIPHYQTLDTSQGDTVSLDCTPQRNQCAEESAKNCEYQVIWYRLYGCPTQRIFNTGRFQLASSSLNIRNATSDDTGMWACKLISTDKNTKIATGSTLKVILLHVRTKENPTGALRCRTGYMVSQYCKQGEICSTKIGPGTSKTSSCFPLVRMDPDLFAELTRQPQMTCRTFFNSPECAVHSTANRVQYHSHCCFCYTKDCNQQDKMSTAQLKWMINNEQMNATRVCRELSSAMQQQQKRYYDNGAISIASSLINVFLSLITYL